MLRHTYINIQIYSKAVLNIHKYILICYICTCAYASACNKFSKCIKCLFLRNRVTKTIGVFFQLKVKFFQTRKNFVCFVCYICMYMCKYIVYKIICYIITENISIRSILLMPKASFLIVFQQLFKGLTEQNVSRLNETFLTACLTYLEVHI